MMASKSKLFWSSAYTTDFHYLKCIMYFVFKNQDWNNSTISLVFTTTLNEESPMIQNVRISPEFLFCAAHLSLDIAMDEQKEESGFL